ncbi:MAG: pyridoxal phosphate-dependent aminotransferase [Halobacteriaceae archaeon]
MSELDAGGPGLADRMQSFQESDIRRMFDLAEEHEGDLVRLEIGEPDFDTPEHIIDAAADAAKGGATHYTHNAGIRELREAIARKLDRDNDLDVEPGSEVAVTVGAMEAVYFSLLATCNPGDEVVIPTPAWVNYFTMAGAVDFEPVEVPLPEETGFALDPDRIADAVTADTRVVVLTTPNNPTGRVFDTDAAREVVEIAAANDAYVIADEVYERITYDTEPTNVAANTPHREHVISVSAFSKTYAMTGWRVGWLAGPDPIVQSVRKLHQASTTCAPSVSQHAALEALEGPQEPIREMLDAFAARREYVVERIDDIDAVDAADPEGGFYVFLDVRELAGSSLDIAERLLTEYGVVTVPGSGFGDAGEGYLRLSFANSKERLAEGFDRIEAMVADEQ